MTSGKYQISQQGLPASSSQAAGHQFTTPQQQPSAYSQLNSHDEGSAPAPISNPVQAQGTNPAAPCMPLKRKRGIESPPETPVPARQKIAVDASQSYINEDLEYDDIQELEDELYEEKFGDIDELPDETSVRVRQPPPELSHRSGTPPNDIVTYQNPYKNFPGTFVDPVTGFSIAHTKQELEFGLAQARSANLTPNDRTMLNLDIIRLRMLDKSIKYKLLDAAPLTRDPGAYNHSDLVNTNRTRFNSLIGAAIAKKSPVFREDPIDVDDEPEVVQPTKGRSQRASSTKNSKANAARSKQRSSSDGTTTRANIKEVMLELDNSKEHLDLEGLGKKEEPQPAETTKNAEQLETDSTHPARRAQGKPRNAAPQNSQGGVKEPPVAAGPGSKKSATSSNAVRGQSQSNDSTTGVSSNPLLPQRDPRQASDTTTQQSTAPRLSNFTRIQPSAHTAALLNNHLQASGSRLHPLMPIYNGTQANTSAVAPPENGIYTRSRVPRVNSAQIIIPKASDTVYAPGNGGRNVPFRETFAGFVPEAIPNSGNNRPINQNFYSSLSHGSGPGLSQNAHLGFPPQALVSAATPPTGNHGYVPTPSFNRFPMDMDMSSIWDTYGIVIGEAYTQGGISLSMARQNDAQGDLATGFSSNGSGTVNPRMLSLENEDSPSENNEYQSFF
ncbi:hypothetical protein DFH27DRAFT_219790 [Peziza echinospora]|nr:hypothetical protein DFH27DRAFT_219790 [Peziza echinospora]